MFKVRDRKTGEIKGCIDGNEVIERKWNENPDKTTYLERMTDEEIAEYKKHGSKSLKESKLTRLANRFFPKHRWIKICLVGFPALAVVLLVVSLVSLKIGWEEVRTDRAIFTPEGNKIEYTYHWKFFGYHLEPHEVVIVDFQQAFIDSVGGKEGLEQVKEENQGKGFSLVPWNGATNKLEYDQQVELKDIEGDSLRDPRKGN